MPLFFQAAAFGDVFFLGRPFLRRKRRKNGGLCPPTRRIGSAPPLAAGRRPPYP